MFNSINPPPLKRNQWKIYKKITIIDFIIILIGLIGAIVTIYSVYPYFFFIWVLVIGVSPICLCAFLIIPVGDYQKIYHWIFYFIYFPLTKRKYRERHSKLLIPYDKVENGYIKLKDGYSIGVFKLQGFNYLTLTDSEVNGVLENYRNFLKQINLPYSIISLDMKISYEGNKNIINNIKFNHDKKIKEISKNILNNIENKQNPDEKAFYIMIYSTKEDLNAKMPYFENNLSDANLTVSRINKEKDLLKLISKFYLSDNKIKNFQELLKGKTRFYRNHILINKKHLRIISLEKLPFQSNLGWIYPLSQIKGVTYIMNVEGYRLSKAIKKIDRAVSSARGNYGSTFRASEEAESMNQINLLMQLSDQIQTESETLLTTNQFLLIKGNSKKELEKIEQEIRELFMANNFLMDTLYFRQKEAWASALPKQKQSLKKSTSIEVPASSMANGFPFYQDALNDPNGLYLGFSKQGSNIFFDPFLITNQRKNHNINILGAPGGGKTTLMSKLIKDQLLLGSKAIVIDPQGEYKKLTESLGGAYLNLGVNDDDKIKKLKINPLQFFNDDAGNNIATQIQFLEAFFRTIFTGIQDLEMQELIKIILQLYKKFKVNSNTETTKFPIMEDLAKLIQKEYKSISKQQNQVWRIQPLYKLSSYFEMFLYKDTPEASMWNGHTNIDIKNKKLFVFDLHTIKASQNNRLLNAQYYLLIRFCFSLMILNRTENQQKAKNKKTKEDFKRQNLMVVVDEAHLLVDEKNPSGLEFLYHFSKTTRKFGAGLVVTTQNMADLLGGSDYIKQKTSALINNAQYSFYFQMNPDDLNVLKQMISSSKRDLSDEEINYVTSAGKGECLLTISSLDRKLIRYDIPEEERFIWKDKDEI